MGQFVLRIRISFEARKYVAQHARGNFAADIVIKIESRLLTVGKALQGMVTDALSREHKSTVDHPPLEEHQACLYGLKPHMHGL